MVILRSSKSSGACLFFSVCLCLSLMSAKAFCDVILKELKDEPGETRLIVENGFYIMELSPEAGGRVTSFRTRPSGKEWIAKKNIGFLADIATANYSQNLMHAVYGYKILKKGADQCVIRFERELDGVWAGTKIVKTVSVNNSPQILVNIVFVNSSKQLKQGPYWVQNQFYPGSKRERFTCFRPSGRGLRMAQQSFIMDKFIPSGDEFVSDPGGGWTATLDRNTEEGAIFLMDYNSLSQFYNCLNAFTSEWFYDTIQLKPGGTWRTSYRIVFLKGFKNVVYASNAIILGLTSRPTEKGIEFAVTAQSVTGKKDMEISLRLNDPVMHLDLPVEGKLLLRTSPDSAVTKKVSIHYPPPRAPVVIKGNINITGKGGNGKIDETFELYYDPSRGMGQYLAPKDERSYKVELPRKIKSKKPMVPPPLPETLSVLHMCGVYFNYDRIAEAVHKLGGKTVPVYFKRGFQKPCLYNPPMSFSDMANYNLVVISDMEADVVGKEQIDYIRYLVEECGGGLLVTGGLFSFEKGGYAGTGLEKLLPVVTGDTFSAKYYSKPVSIRQSTDSPISPGSMVKDAMLSWRHRFAKLKDGAEVWLSTTEGEPLLIVWKKGRGRVAVWAGMPLENPENPYWRSDAWLVVWEKILWWLAFGEFPKGS